MALLRLTHIVTGASPPTSNYQCQLPVRVQNACSVLFSLFIYSSTLMTLFRISGKYLKYTYISILIDHSGLSNIILYLINIFICARNYLYAKT